MRQYDDDLEDELDEDNVLERALGRAVMPKWAWPDIKGNAHMEAKVQQILQQPGGGTRMVGSVALLGAPAMTWIKKMMEQAGLSPEQVARDYTPGGEFNTCMAAIMGGSERWLKWLLRHGANPDWKDVAGRNLVCYLYSPDYIENMVDGESIGNRKLSRETAREWIVGQQRCVVLLQKQGQLWQQLCQRTHIEPLKKVEHNIERLRQAYWVRSLDAETQTLLKAKILEFHASVQRPYEPVVRPRPGM